MLPLAAEHGAPTGADFCGNTESESFWKYSPVYIHAAFYLRTSKAKKRAQIEFICCWSAFTPGTLMKDETVCGRLSSLWNSWSNFNKTRSPSRWHWKGAAHVTAQSEVWRRSLEALMTASPSGPAARCSVSMVTAALSFASFLPLFICPAEKILASQTFVLTWLKHNWGKMWFQFWVLFNGL